MLYTIIRFIIFGILLLAGVLIAKRIKTNKKTLKKVVTGAVVFVLATVISIIPFENLFVSFDTPEAAFGYSRSGNICSVFEGKESALIIYKINPGIKRNFIAEEKSADGWKIGTGFDVRIVFSTIKDGVTVTVYQYKNTNDYYVNALCLDENDTAPRDCRGSEFTAVEASKKQDGSAIYSYYAYVDNVVNDYELYYNGVTVEINE